MLVYLWELIHTVPGQEEPYMASVLAVSERSRFFSAEGLPKEGDYRVQVGLFRTTEVSGTWPKVINLWGERDWHQFVANLKGQFTDARHVDMEEWWNRNLTLRRGGFDRVLLPVDFSPNTIQLAQEGIKGRVFLHEIVKVPWGEVPNYLARLKDTFLPAAQRFGWHLIGAYTVAWRPREVLTLWGLSEWQRLTDLLAAADTDAELRSWFAYRDQIVTHSEELVLLPGRVNPLHPAA